MRLGDLDALKKSIDTIKQTGYDTNNEPLFEYVELPDLIKAIDNAPTVDVEQIKSELNPTVTSWYDFDRGYEKGYEKAETKDHKASG